MPLVRIPEPFDDRDWIFELKLDGFRALALRQGGGVRLVSRHGHTLRFAALADALVEALSVTDAILDGEIVCLDADGRPQFKELLFRRGTPIFAAFDLLWLNGEDLRSLPLVERKRRLRLLVPRSCPSLLYVAHVDARGVDLFKAACEQDLEGIVGKWGRGGYLVDGERTSWVKIKNPDYSQAIGRRELFERRGPARKASFKARRLVLA